MHTTPRSAPVAVWVLLAALLGGAPGRCDVKSVLAREQESESKGPQTDPAESPASQRGFERAHRREWLQLRENLLPYRHLPDLNSPEAEWTRPGPTSAPNLGEVLGTSTARTSDGKPGPAPHALPATTFQALRRVYAAMDSVRLGPAERQALVLEFPNAPSLPLEDLLSWVDTFAVGAERRWGESERLEHQRTGQPGGMLPAPGAAAGIGPTPILRPPPQGVPKSPTLRTETAGTDGFETNGQLRPDEGRRFQDSAGLAVVLRRMLFWSAASRQKRSQIPPTYGEPVVQRALAQLALSLESDPGR